MRALLTADIGLNHNADIEIAKKLIDYCAFFKVDFVKFQKRNPDICVPDDQKNVMRDTPWGRMTYIDYRWRMEFGKEEYDQIDEYCNEKGIEWVASVWDDESFGFIADYNPLFIKIPSACFTDTGLLNTAYLSGVPIALSTGAADWNMIDVAVDTLGDSLQWLLHCTSTYPCPVEEQNLSCITTLKQRYPDIRVGYSNHHPGIPGNLVAMALGAEMVEFHITLSRSMWGSDHAASAEPEGIMKMCKYRDYIEKAMGDGEKHIYPSEIPIMKKLRRIHNGN